MYGPSQIKAAHMSVLVLGIGVRSYPFPAWLDHSCVLLNSYMVLVYSVLALTPYAEMEQLTTEVSFRDGWGERLERE